MSNRRLRISNLADPKGKDSPTKNWNIETFVPSFLEDVEIGGLVDFHVDRPDQYPSENQHV